ncbi:MAG: SGNH/GDSL hydrolase family protein [bacterium]|jgi:lysophospholipase L1-like esterase
MIRLTREQFYFLNFLSLIIALTFVPSIQAADQYDPTRWESTIQEFVKQDQKTGKEADILFLGSSSIRMWNLEKSFPDMNVLNRGFGGSHIEDSVYYFDRLVLPHEPEKIVFYAGDNDINAGKSPEQVLKDYQQLVQKVREHLPETEIIYLSIKPSIARWDKVENMRKANQLIEEYSRQHENLYYVDLDTPMLGEDGKPRPELFIKDNLHLSEEGYKLWTEKVLPYLKNGSND